MRLCILIVFLLSQLACERWHNRVNALVLDCGDDARDHTGRWVKILDPSGQELPEGLSLDARTLILNDQGQLMRPLAVSRKNCVALVDDETVVVRAKANDRNWSVLLLQKAIPWSQRVSLQDNRNQSLQLACPKPWVTQGPIRLPLTASAGTVTQAFALSSRLERADGRKLAGSFGLQGETPASEIPLPPDWPDGAVTLTLTSRNFLEAEDSSQSQEEQTCDLVVDRSLPVLNLLPNALPNQALEVQPGERLQLSIQDLNAGQLEWCLEPKGSGACLDSLAVKREGSQAIVPMPSQGEWTLYAHGFDLAGNAAKPLELTIRVIQEDLIASILAKTDQARAEKSTEGLAAAESLLRSLFDFQRLVLPEEKARVKAQLIDSLLEVAPFVKERNRRHVSGDGQQVFAIGGAGPAAYLVRTNQELSLWTASGRLLQTLAVEKSWAADWSKSEQALVLGTEESVQIYRLRQDKLELSHQLKWSDVNIYGLPASLRWIPGTQQFLLGVSLDLPAIFEDRSEGISLIQRLDLKDAEKLAVHPQGTYLAVATSDEISVWQKQKGTWLFLDSSERPNQAIEFVGNAAQDPSQMFVLDSWGALIQWSADRVWKELDPGVPGENPSTPNPAVRPLQTWASGGAGLIERGGRFYQWQLNASKTLQPIPLSGFAWDRLVQWKIDTCQKAVWLQDDRTISYWTFQEGPSPRFTKSAEWLVAPDVPIDFINRCQPNDLEFLTLAGQNKQLRFWSAYGPLPTLEGDSKDVSFSRFVPGFAEGERLVTAGFDGVIRLWSRFGVKLFELLGHLGQINDVNFNASTRQWISSAEDSQDRLWKEDGGIDRLLRPTPNSGTRLRDGATFIDSESIITTGSQSIDVWHKDALGDWKLNTSIPVAAGERSGPDSIRILGQGPSLRVFASIGKRRGFFLNRKGELLPVESGLPDLWKVTRLEMSPDGQRLALIDLEKRFRLFVQASEGIWMEENIQDLAQALQGALQQIHFASQRNRLALVLKDQSLQVWHFDQKKWRVQAQRPPALGFINGKFLAWSRDQRQLIYDIGGQIFILDDNLQQLHRVQAFEEKEPLQSLAVSESDPFYLAAGQGTRVRLLDFNLERLKAQYCLWLADYLAEGDTDRDVTGIRQMCQRAG